jgi:succinate dehydrogenase/fumarate reductase-like Fe-S protein
MNEPPRNWLTASEFLAEVEAHRQARLKNPVKLTPMEARPVVRIYVLDWSHKFKPRRQSQAASLPEVQP